MAGNANLGAARAVKNDEFYTQWNDIENEMQAYLEYDPGVFRGKTVLLPCDDPEWSNFTRFFVHNFTAFGIKKLISTSYMPRRNGRIFVMESGSKSDGSIEWEHLDGDGDFRSDEVTALRDEADMVITNPPFSLYREFVAWLIEGEVEYSIIGNVNSVTYKEIFPLIKGNEMWIGSRSMSIGMLFDLPESRKAELIATEEPGSKYRIVDGDVRGRAASLWFTNIEHGRRNKPLALMTMEYNLIHGSKRVRETAYPHYDNYGAIEVPEVMGIPSDYEGVMGVPISFLDKYDPEQFEILGSQRWGKSQELLDVYTGAVAPPENDKKTLINGKETYDRIFIRHRNPERKESQPLSRSWNGRSSLRCKREFSHVEVRG